MASTDYTVYTVGDEVADTNGYAPPLPDGAQVWRVTTDWYEAEEMIRLLIGRGYSYKQKRVWGP